MKKDSIIINALILFGITLIAGLLLGLTFNVTAEPRAYQTKLKTEVALNAVLEDTKFQELEVEGDTKFVTKVYKGTTEDNGGGDLKGYAYQLETTEGYGDVIKLMVGINADGTISGIDIVSHTETPGLGAAADGDKFKDQFKSKLAEKLYVKKGAVEPQEIDAMGGATITSNAVTNAVNDAIEYFNTNNKEGN